MGDYVTKHGSTFFQKPLCSHAVYLRPISNLQLMCGMEGRSSTALLYLVFSYVHYQMQIAFTINDCFSYRLSKLVQLYNEYFDQWILGSNSIDGSKLR